MTENLNKVDNMIKCDNNEYKIITEIDTEPYTAPNIVKRKRRDMMKDIANTSSILNF